MATLGLVALLAWLPLSFALAVVVGKSIKFGMGEPDARLVPKPRASRRPQKLFRAQTSA